MFFCPLLDFDEQTADDWDVDMSVYYDKGMKCPSFLFTRGNRFAHFSYVSCVFICMSVLRLCFFLNLVFYAEQLFNSISEAFSNLHISTKMRTAYRGELTL